MAALAGITAGLGLYVHIPFCARKCTYCDFPSYAGKMSLRGDYVRALAQEIARAGELHGRPQTDTVYIGGGTPTLLMPAQMQTVLEAIHAAFTLSPQVEFSCEANPGMVSDAMLDTLVQGGVNRLSLGAQSTNAQELAALGRQHTWPQVADAVQRARRAGIKNLNIDLMMGLPGQTMATFDDTLSAVLALAPAHISCYGLIVEEGTPLAASIQAGTLTLPPEDEERALYDLALARLSDAGYARYEVSNFARPGYACLHNLHCWQRVPYVGFGAAAHSLMPGLDERRANPADISAYLSGCPAQVQQLTPQEQRFESIMLGLRMVEGVSLDAFEAMHGMPMEDVYAAPMRRAVDSGRAEILDGAFRLTPGGMDVMNAVLVDFLDEGQE
jgi:oxygen-independent coproporphyrinogen-3 oxidase